MLTPRGGGPDRPWESRSPFLTLAGPSEQTPISHPARGVQCRLHGGWGRLAAGPPEAAVGKPSSSGELGPDPS